MFQHHEILQGSVDLRLRWFSAVLDHKFVTNQHLKRFKGTLKLSSITWDYLQIKYCYSTLQLSSLYLFCLLSQSPFLICQIKNIVILLESEYWHIPKSIKKLSSFSIRAIDLLQPVFEVLYLPVSWMNIRVMELI